MSDSVRLFSIDSGQYAQFRPTYPASLFTWLAEKAPRHTLALDVAAGSGQATQGLVPRFDTVLACDASVTQLQEASGWATAKRFAANAERLPLTSGTVDLLVVAQALHWFATPDFFAEARRVLTADGLFCAWCYGLLRLTPRIDAIIDHLHGTTLRGYWPDGRASVDAGYRDIRPSVPFPLIEPPAFFIEAHWRLDQLLGYLRTWSAVRQWQQIHGEDPIEAIAASLQHLWGNPERELDVRWPLHFITGYPGAQETPCPTNC